MRAEARFRPCSSPKAMSKGERPFLRRPNSGAAFDPKQKDAECCAGATPPPRIFQIRKRNPFAGRSRFNPEYAGNDMGKTLFAIAAAGGGVAMGLTTGAILGSAIANTFFNVSSATIRAMRRLRR